jgi:hypothetical protein
MAPSHDILVSMTDEAVAAGIQQNKALKKEMLDRHRPAFEVWLRLAQLLEEAAVKTRQKDSAFAHALDLFFLEAFKSHQSLYVLCIRGHGEDAATIARRLFEIALQTGYLCSEEPKREERAETFLAHFWHNAKDILGAIDLPEERRKWWEQQYNHHKKWLIFNKHGEPANYWFRSNFAQLAEELGFKDTYDKDYRLLSHIAHCSSRGLLLDKIGDTIQIKSDRLIREILIYGSKYMLWVAAHWNEHFSLMDSATLEDLRDKMINFDFKTNS